MPSASRVLIDSGRTFSFMPPSAYPASSLPLPTRYTVAAPEYSVSQSPEFQDGGIDRNLNADTPVRRFIIEYAQLTTAEAAILDAHYDSAFGVALGFNYTERESGTTYANTHYEKYERSRVKASIQTRTVTLVKRP
jgi:hypothetical protein